MDFAIEKMRWVGRPASFGERSGGIEIVTAPHTDLWQRTYYGFRNDNALMLLFDTAEKFFSFSVRTRFTGKRRYSSWTMELSASARLPLAVGSAKSKQPRRAVAAKRQAVWLKLGQFQLKYVI